MKPDTINLADKQLEQSVIDISVKIADAVEIAQRSMDMADTSKDMLIKAQLELEELYIALDAKAVQENHCVFSTSKFEPDNSKCDISKP